MEKELFIEGFRFVEAASDSQSLDFKDCYMIPGLIDLHFHGAVGEDVSDASHKGLRKMAEFELREGVTQICPASMTLWADELLEVTKMLLTYKRTTQGQELAELVGLNLEGPFLSYEKRVAQNPDFFQTPNIKLLWELYEASDKLCKLVTVAPELEGGGEFIEQASKFILVSLEHTCADYECAKQAFELGARQITHMFNAMPPLSHRALGVIGAAKNQNVNAELICDLVHIHESVIRASFKLFGPERIIMISDSCRGAGMPHGQYTRGGQVIIVRDHIAKLESGIIAGSVTNLMDCLRNVVKIGIPLKDAVITSAYNPVKAIGVDTDYGSIEPGKIANFVVLDKNLETQAIFLNGQKIS
ncbi:MAG: N-acetylglucosamine-6-phosphate deacetylase [Eggerthellaceae bacterium]|nr:N-acetylglucosamine-6-phosphate deacetylase [Eggerthellaceae bacterium]